MTEEPTVFLDKNLKINSLTVNIIELVDDIQKLKIDLKARDKEIIFLKKAVAYFAQDQILER